MRFSIIVPIYKVEKYINQCIESVLSQTYEDFELILVDDGSPDDCGKICDEYAKQDSRVSVIHKLNGGLVSARQAGVKIAQGDYIACLDGDDYISDDFCFKCNKVIESRFPDIVVCGLTNVYDNHIERLSLKEREGYYNRSDLEREIFPYLIEDRKGNYFSPTLCGKVIERKLYTEEQLCIDENVKIGEDQCCSKPCVYRADSVYIMKDCLYNYRQNSMSMTKKGDVFNLFVPRIIAKHYETRLDMMKFDFQEQVYRRVVHDLFNAAASQFNAKDGYKKAKKRILSALNDDYYKLAIKKADFKFMSKGWIAKILLRCKLLFLIFLYNKKHVF